jgi:hypothetical protein
MNRVLKRVPRPKRGKNRRWRKLHNKEVCNLYLSPNINRMVKWRRMRWVGHVSRMEQMRNVGIQGGIMRKGFTWLRVGTCGRLLKT